MTSRSSIENPIAHAARPGRRRFLALTSLGASATAFFAACGGSSKEGGATSSTAGSSSASAGSTRAPTAAASDVQTGGHLQYGASRDVTTLDPHVGTLGDEIFAYAGLFEGSLTYNGSAELVPGLAERFEYPDNTTIVMRYRPNVVFHDGESFSAQTVKANLDRYLAPATAAPGAAALTKAIDRIEVVDPTTVRFTLTQPDATALASIGLIRMISPAAIDRFGKDLARNPVGTAAFKFKEWLKDDHLTMERFPNYWNGAKAPPRVPRLDQFTFKPVVEPAVMLANLKTRNIHVAGSVQPVDAATLRSEPGITVVERAPSSCMRLLLNTTQAPMDQLRVRQAIDLGVDREALARAVFFGLGKPGNSAFPPTHWLYPKDRPAAKRDVAAAKAKLREAGLVQGAKVTMNVVAAEPYRSVAQVVQASLGEIGLGVEIRQMESGQALEALKRRDGHISISVIGNRSDPDGFFSGNLKADSPFNFSGFNDPEFERVLAEGLRVTDQKQRGELYRKAEQRLIDEVPAVFLYFISGLYAHVKDVQEFNLLDFVGGAYDATWLKRA